MKIKHLIMVLLMLSAFGMTACSSDDDDSTTSTFTLTGQDS